MLTIKAPTQRNPRHFSSPKYAFLHKKYTGTHPIPVFAIIFFKMKVETAGKKEVE
jgi:hypothetical protein